MPIGRVELWSKTDAEFKKKFARGLTKVASDNVKCPAQAVTILFDEFPKENWAIGGEPAANLCRRMGIED